MWFIHISSEDERIRIEAAGGWVEGDYLNVHHELVISSLATSRSFGDKVFKQNPSLKAEEQIVTAAPTISRIVAHANDVVLICCDVDAVLDGMTERPWKCDSKNSVPFAYSLSCACTLIEVWKKMAIEHVVQVIGKHTGLSDEQIKTNTMLLQKKGFSSG